MIDLRHPVLWAYALLALLFFAISKAPIKDAGDMAAWVQGVGTILGVFAAIFAAFWPVEAARRTRVLEQLAFATSIETAIKVVDASMQPVRVGVTARDSTFITGGLGIYQEINPFELLDALLGEPQSKWPDPALYASALAYRNSVRKLDDRIERLTRPWTHDQEAGPLSWITPTSASPSMIEAAWKTLDRRLESIDIAQSSLGAAVALFSRTRT